MTPEQVSMVVDEIRERVRSRHEKRVAEVPDFELPALDSLGHARDAALGKSAAIGTVNPRPPGFLNNAIQSVKKTVARSLNWFVRDQVDFNGTVIDYMDRNTEVQIEQNHNLLRVAKTVAAMEVRQAELQTGIQDMLKHWNAWRPAWEKRFNQAETHLLQTLRDVESAARDRESAFHANAVKMHDSYEEALKRATDQIQRQVWDDLGKLKSEQEHLIHTELRLIRRRASVETVPQPAPEPAGPGGAATNRAPQLLPPSFDYTRFEERFRGGEAYVRETQQFYLRHFQGCQRVLDLGCGRGEFLEVLRDAGIEATGVDADADMIAACREKGLSAEQGDLFAFLHGQPHESISGIFCAHVVEHLPPLRLPELITLAAAKLAPGGILAIETPNPACLAIFARDFYLDPTHVRPVPSNQLHFYLGEAGLVNLEVHELHPASEVYSEIAALDQVEALREFRQKFFGGLDYAILGRKWKG